MSISALWVIFVPKIQKYLLYEKRNHPIYHRGALFLWRRRTKRQGCVGCHGGSNDGKRWRFVAKYEDGHASVGLSEIPQSHPFYRLEGSNNIVLLTTERYREYPMLIQGYGAGASVTAAGVFADIMSIANI